MKKRINYAWPVTSENSAVYRYLLRRIEEIEGFLKGKRIAIFGAGIRGCCILKILENQGFSNVVFIDNNVEKQGNAIYEYDILSLEVALDYEKEQIILVAPENSENICNQLREKNMIENQEWFSLSVSAYDSYVCEYSRKVQDYLLVMGDCAFTHISLKDTNMDSLGDLIKNEYGIERCKVLSMHGMGQQAFFHISKALIERGEKPKGLLLLLMMETLAPKVPIMPRTQHAPLINQLVKVTEHPNPEFVAYSHLTKERAGRFQREEFSSYDNEIMNMKKEMLHMEMSYLFRYRENTEGVNYLIKLVKMMNENGIPVTFYVPPVNYFQGEKLFGEDFKEKYEKNFKCLYNTLNQENLIYKVIDASYLLDIDDFAEMNTVDETCNYCGREKILHYILNKLDD